DGRDLFVDLEREWPLVADGEHRVRRRPRGPARLEVARAGLAEPRRVGHQPSCVDRVRDGAYLEADRVARQLLLFTHFSSLLSPLDLLFERRRFWRHPSGGGSEGAIEAPFDGPAPALPAPSRGEVSEGRQSLL